MNLRHEEKISDYIARVLDMHEKVQQGGFGFSDNVLALILMIVLPKQYEPLILNLQAERKNTRFKERKSSSHRGRMGVAATPSAVSRRGSEG